MTDNGVKIDGIAAVTGAGQGIGLALTVEFARRGIDVLATVPEESMGAAVREHTAGLPGSVELAVLDVTKPGDFAFPDELRIVVNNAGIRLAYLPIEMTPEDQWRAVFDVNFFGLVEVTRRAIPVLRKAGTGVICNISSGSLFVPIPFLGPYRASKAAVSNLCETLRVELAPFGIRIVDIMPGATVSGINADSIAAGHVADAVRFPEYAPMAHRQRELNSEIPPATPAADAAVAIVDAILDGGGPMRYGTDAVSNQLLEMLRTTSEEEIAVEVLRRFGVSGPAGR
ncbi:MAG TPA: SDR family NAD(P)-dependent oxidoreductase [Mycobacteriales bacterium]|nr:SDR family NAD(P)-dependent oxidoreductase [Mycobacteriales bacterium]